MKNPITLLFTFLVVFATKSYTQDSSRIYLNIGATGSTAYAGGIGASLFTGVRGPGAASIGLGADFMKFTNVGKPYIPIYLSVQPFYKRLYGIIQAGSVPYNETTENIHLRYTGGFYWGAGAGFWFTPSKFTGYAQIRYAHLPYYKGDVSLSEGTVMLTMGIKF